MRKEKTMKKKTLAKIGVFAAAAALAVVSAACGSNDDSANSGDASGLPDKIVIGYQNIPNGDLIVKHDGLLEAAFGDSVSVEWKLFDSGGSVNEAILAGAIDIGLVGSSPASRGISSGIEYQIPWIFDVIGKAEALAVKGGINSIADLKGKTIATPFASTSHYSLLAALEEAGLSESDVKVIDSEPDAILAAWQQGDIDGAYVWNPVLAKLTADGGKVLITSEDLSKKGKTTYDLAVVTTSFATKYPAAVQIWLDQQNAAITKIRDDADGAAKSIAAELNIPEADAKQQLSELIFLDASEQAGAEYLGGGLARNLFAAAQFNLKLGKIESVKEETAYNAAILTTFASAAK
jgi:taurine transport system substrate-binding protein